MTLYGSFAPLVTTTVPLLLLGTTTSTPLQSVSHLLTQVCLTASIEKQPKWPCLGSRFDGIRFASSLESVSV